MEAIKSFGIKIQKDSIAENQYRMLCRDLTCITTSYVGEKLIQSFYVERNNNIFIPRHYPIHRICPDIKIVNATSPGKDIDIEHNIKYRPVQEKAVKFIKECWREGYDPIIKLRPGIGKTVLTIGAIAELKKKTIVVVDRRKLVNQWHDRFKTFANADVSILDLDKIGDHSIYITTVQKMLYGIKNYGHDLLMKLLEIDPGIVVFDEVHSLIGPEQFTKVSLLFRPRQFIFLSATPVKAGPLAKIFHYWIGDKLFTSSYDIEPVIVPVIIHSNISNKTIKWICWGGKLNIAKYVKQLCKNETYIGDIVNLVYKLRAEGRRVLVLAHQIKMLEAMLEKLGKDQVGTFYGKKRCDLSQNIILATYSMCNKAIDLDHDTLILATPISGSITLEQSIGRVLRSKSPKVYDIIDSTVKTVEALYYNRRYSFYRSHNWQVEKPKQIEEILYGSVQSY